MKYIIFYNECLRSKLIYYNFIRKNYKNIKCVIEIPIHNTNNKFFLIKKGIFNNNAYSFIFYQLFQTIFYNLFSIIFSSNIRSICKKFNISFKKIDKFPDKNKIKNIVKNYNEKDIIFISTTYILKHKDLMIKNLILNLHEADPRIYRGSAIYYRLANDKKKYMKTVIMEPNSEIDGGRVVASSNKKLIKNLSVFKILLMGYSTQSKLLEKISNTNIKKKYPKIKSRGSSVIYSFPSRKLEIELKKKKIKTISLKDYLFIVYLSIIRDISKLYSKINVYLNK